MTTQDELEHAALSERLDDLTRLVYELRDELGKVGELRGEDRVSFGAQSMPKSWAEAGLTWLHTEQGEIFGEMMCAIVGVPAGAPAAKRGRKPANV